MPYSVRFAPAALRQFRKLPAAVQRRLSPHIDELAADPRPPGVVKLSGVSDIYRVRVGDYRIVYEIQDAALVILVLKVGDRRDVYR